MSGDVRCAFYARVSTDDNQDPTLSIPRQLNNCQDKIGGINGEIVAHYYDVESGDSRLDQRGSGRRLRGFDIPIPRDGGLHELIEDARSGRFDVVICESINRFARRPAVTFTLEEELMECGVKLWPIDEPWEESFGSIVLRHVNVGVARGFLYDLKVKSRQGIETAARQGRHPGGKPLYGYRFRVETHPNPRKAAQGQQVKFLEPDPVQAPVVRMIYEDYVVHGMSLSEIQQKLNSDVERYPTPESPDPARRRGEWGRSSLWEILHNPKYTGFQVWNRRQRKRGGKVNPPEKWIWSDEPAHEALVSKETFDQGLLLASRNYNAAKAQQSNQPNRKRIYALRSFMKCGVCGLRMLGNFSGRNKYYLCRTDRRPSMLVPEGHPRTVYVAEDWATERVLRFLRNNIFGPDRIRLLSELLASTDPHEDDKAVEAEWLRKELVDLGRKIERQLGHLEAEDPHTEVAKTLRLRLEELTAHKTRREKELEQARRALSDHPTAEGVAPLLNCLPLMDIDIEALEDEDFRLLLDALAFEARYQPEEKRLGVWVTLTPEILRPEEGQADLLKGSEEALSAVERESSDLLYVPPVGLEPTL
jgi:site-specific DNA recombinase